MVMTLAAYTSTRIGTMGLQTTSSSMPVRSGGGLFGCVRRRFVGLMRTGVGVTVPEANAGVTIAGDDGLNTPTNAYSCACYT